MRPPPPPLPSAVICPVLSASVSFIPFRRTSVSISLSPRATGKRGKERSRWKRRASSFRKSSVWSKGTTIPRRTRSSRRTSSTRWWCQMVSSTARKLELSSRLTLSNSDAAAGKRQRASSCNWSSSIEILRATFCLHLTLYFADQSCVTFLSVLLVVDRYASRPLVHIY